MTPETIEENILFFENLMNQVYRAGKDDLMRYLRKSDFFTAPASTNFHLACEGGLLAHSLAVYQCLISKRNNPLWRTVLADIPNESFIIAACLHDLCKANFYTMSFKNQKTYEPDKVAAAQLKDIKHDDAGDFIWETVPRWTIREDEPYPFGHGEKSVILIQQYMKLTLSEALAIRFHMGFSEDKSLWNSLGKAMESQPLTLALYESDLESSKLLETNKDIRENILF